VHAERAQQELGRALQDPDRGPEHPGHQRDRRRDERRQRLGAIERERLRDQLPEHHRQIGDDGERDQERHPGGDRFPEQVAHERLADRAGEDPDRRDADLDRRDHADRVLHQLQRGRGAAAVAPRERRPARGDDRVLPDHEERVARDQREQRDDA
jgi:hypothetical protein